MSQFKEISITTYSNYESFDDYNVQARRMRKFVIIDSIICILNIHNFLFTKYDEELYIVMHYIVYFSFFLLILPLWGVLGGPEGAETPRENGTPKIHGESYPQLCPATEKYKTKKYMKFVQTNPILMNMYTVYGQSSKQAKFRRSLRAWSSKSKA